jgi:hypothetical protein
MGNETTVAHTPVKLVLEQLARELRSMDDRLRHIEYAIGHLLENGHTSRNAVVAELQSIDIVSQTLNALSGFSDRLAECAPDSWVVDVETASTDVLLAAVARRLCLPHAAHPVTDHGHADVEYFDA